MQKRNQVGSEGEVSIHRSNNRRLEVSILSAPLVVVIVGLRFIFTLFGGLAFAVTGVGLLALRPPRPSLPLGPRPGRNGVSQRARATRRPCR